VHYTQQQGVKGVTVDDVYLGNGASELIQMADQRAASMTATRSSCRRPTTRSTPGWWGYRAAAGALCLRRAGRLDADVADIRAKITPRTKGIVIINPNNPTGALYPTPCCCKIINWPVSTLGGVGRRDLRQGAVRRREAHTSMASLADDVLILTFNGLSKNYRSCGYRAGWMVVSGQSGAKDFIEGLNMLAS
jgi:alanine-synthesizing transaminase